MPIIYKKPEISSGKLSEILEWSDDRVLSAVNYLKQEELIFFNNSDILMSGIILNLKCTSEGIKVIEMPEYSKSIYRGEFQINFIINVNIDALVKANIESIFKVSMFK